MDLYIRSEGFMKRIISVLLSLICAISLFSCSNKIDPVKLAKSFYTEYLNVDVVNEAELKKVKEKYMTPVLIEELELRSMQMEADSITGVQDAYGMKDIMEVNNGVDKDTATVTFNMKNQEAETIRVIESVLHFKSVDGKNLMDALDMIIIDYENSNNDNTREYTTKYANKEELTADDINEMNSIRKHYEDLYNEGYIG